MSTKITIESDCATLEEVAQAKVFMGDIFNVDFNAKIEQKGKTITATLTDGE